MADMESRMNTVEHEVEDQAKRIASAETKISCIEKACAQEKVDFAGLKSKVEASLANHDSTMQLLKWVIIIAVTVIGALAGVKIVLPGA
jgi:predicted  nucleic acid-binding Zn-ribbon protein